MSGGKPPISEEVRQAIMRDALPRITAPRDKELMAKYRISRAALHRILKEARDSMRQLSHSEECETSHN